MTQTVKSSGYSRAIRNLIFAPTVKLLCGKEDATAYFALAPLLTIVLSSGLPVVSGLFLDKTSQSGAISYRILFGILASLILLSFYFLKKTDLRED